MKNSGNSQAQRQQLQQSPVCLLGNARLDRLPAFDQAIRLRQAQAIAQARKQSGDL